MPKAPPANLDGGLVEVRRRSSDGVGQNRDITRPTLV